MPDHFAEIIKRHALTPSDVSHVTGVSERTARAWIEGEKHAPETARRLILIVYGDAMPEDYRP